MEAATGTAIQVAASSKSSEPGQHSLNLNGEK